MVPIHGSAVGEAGNHRPKPQACAAQQLAFSWAEPEVKITFFAEKHTQISKYLIWVAKHQHSLIVTLQTKISIFLTWVAKHQNAPTQRSSSQLLKVNA